jgi:hypothetical protein
MTHSDLEKVGNGEVEHAVSKDSNDTRISELSLSEQKSVIRRIDLRLVSMLGILYCASLMDRTNLSAANIAGFVACPCS